LGSELRSGDSMDDVKIHKKASKPANNYLNMCSVNQLRTKTSVVQKMIDTSTSGMTATTGTMPNNPFMGLPNANKTVKKLQNTTAPADPPGMSTWKAKGYLGDPSKMCKQALTRMHAVRGRFGGPSAPNNMFLGTALSNNFHTNSHYKEVEKPLESYLEAGKALEKRAFDYTVSPNFNHPPPYMLARINNPAEVKSTDKSNFNKFAQDHIPHGFNCSATLYRIKSGTLESKTVHQVVSTDIGVSGGGGYPAPLTTKVNAELPTIKYGIIGAGLGSLGSIASGLALGPMVGAGLAVGALYGYATAEHD
jgi:hypothetical protein